MKQTPEPEQAGGTPLDRISASAARWHAEMERLLDLTIEARTWGGVPGAAGLTVHDYLVHEAGLPYWLATQLESVADRIDSVPEVARRFRDGLLSFDHLAGFVRETAGWNGEQLARLDTEAASLADALAVEGRLSSWVAEAGFLVDDLRAPGWAQRAERQTERGMSASIQFGLFGMGRLTADLPTLELTQVGTALDTAAAQVATDQPRGRALALGLVHITATWTDATSGTKKPVQIVVHIDLAHATTDRFGQLLTLAGGDTRLTNLSARLTDTIAANAELLLQIRDGANPLVRLAEAGGAAIPAAVRRAVLARDRGCRWPGCRVPLRLVQVHHVVHREHGGTNEPANLLTLCGFHHLRHVHRHGWTPHLADDGLVTFTRPGSKPRSSMPNGHRPAPARDPAHLPDWLAPPRPPPPEQAPPDLVPT